MQQLAKSFRLAVDPGSHEHFAALYFATGQGRPTGLLGAVLTPRGVLRGDGLLET